MLCVPVVSVLLLQAAVRVLPAPVRATALHVGMVIPPSVKFTGPVGPFPVTDAVNVTLPPSGDGLIELAILVVVGGLTLTACDSVELVDRAFEPSPE